MSGADLSQDDIANGVFHALYPECPAYPGRPNPCDAQICDCFNCEQLPGKVSDVVRALRVVSLWLRMREGPPPQVRCERALGRLAEVDIRDILGDLPGHGVGSPEPTP